MMRNAASPESGTAGPPVATAQRTPHSAEETQGPRNRGTSRSNGVSVTKSHLPWTHHSNLSSSKKSSFNATTMTATACTSYLTVLFFLAIGSKVRKSTSPIPVIFTTWQVKLCISSVGKRNSRTQVHYLARQATVVCMFIKHLCTSALFVRQELAV